MNSRPEHPEMDGYGDRRASGAGAKPRLSLADYEWMVAFEKMKKCKRGTKLDVNGAVYIMDFVLDLPHPPSLWLIRKEGRKKERQVLRLKDRNPLIYALAAAHND